MQRKIQNSFVRLDRHREYGVQYSITDELAVLPQLAGVGLARRGGGNMANVYTTE